MSKLSNYDKVKISELTNDIDTDNLLVIAELYSDKNAR